METNLSDHLLAKAEEELNEVPSETVERIRLFRTSVENIPLLNSRTDDAFLLRFLRARKFKQERALELLQNYYKQRIKYPDLYKDLQASAIPHVLAEPLLGKLPYKDDQGRTIFVMNSTQKWDPSTVPLNDVIRYNLIALERAIDEVDLQICGAVLLIDSKGFGLNHFLCHTPPMLAKTVSVLLNSFPCRFKELHVINEPMLFRMMYFMLKPFLSDKLKKRFFFHGADLNSLHQIIPKDVLPEEFGGPMGPFTNSEWNRDLLENDPVLANNNTYGYREE